ncbi:MAG: RsmG family class I SAM-dependent methyltransferase [Trueperaceae bacterium]
MFHVKQSAAEGLTEYRELVERYHTTLDLVSDRALASFSTLIEEAERYADLVASLSPAADSILDLGSGVGLPGIPLALALPASRVVLVERRRRRASFLRIVASQLSLGNVTVVHDDVRSIHGPCVDVITAQAVGSLREVYRLSRHLTGESVWLVSRKGPRWVAELAELEAELGASATEVREEALPPHGTLVAVLLPGGSACPPSG